MKLYETTFIADAQLKEEGWESMIDKYSGIINQNGTIKQIDRWGVRRLAYEINKQTHGYYVHVIHESASSVPRDLERQFQLDENCMRHLTVLADNPKYIDEMNKAKARQAEAAEASAQSDDSSDDSDDDRDSDRRPARNNERNETGRGEDSGDHSDADSGDEEDNS